MISVKTDRYDRTTHDTVVVFTWEGLTVKNVIPADLQSCATIKEGITGLSGKKGEKRMLFLPDSTRVVRLLLVGLGKETKFTPGILRETIADICKYAALYDVQVLSLHLSDKFLSKVHVAHAARIITESAYMAMYAFTKFKTRKKKDQKQIKKLVLLEDTDTKQNAVAADIEEARVIGRAVNTARDLCNAPANKMSPKMFAAAVTKRAEECGLSYEVFDKKRIEKERFGALLAVAQGAQEEPVFLVLHHPGSSKKAKRICFVGKGVCFDAGGISLKPSAKMGQMKYDMSGAAVCSQAVLAAHEMNVPHEVYGIIPLCENMPDGAACHPGDVIKTRAGLTVEIDNTDAEGRLILSDALSYARGLKPDAIVDLATLTGAAAVCLGSKAAAVMGTDDDLMAALIAAGEAVGERLWKLPLWEAYKDDLKSDVADISNMGSDGAGTIIGGKFLEHFVEGCTWAHIDIAAVSWEKKGTALCARGATGFGVRLLLSYLGHVKG